MLVISICPFCKEETNVMIIERNTEVLINEEIAPYLETVYYVPCCNEEYTPALVLSKNIKRVRESYVLRKL